MPDVSIVIPSKDRELSSLLFFIEISKPNDLLSFLLLG
jgi:hypothetical protein